MIKKILEESGLNRILKTILSDDINLFFDLCAYTIIMENNAAQYYPNYAYNHFLFTEKMKIFSDSKVSRFLQEIRKEKSIEFLNMWNQIKKADEKIYISYDSKNNEPLFYE